MDSSSQLLGCRPAAQRGPQKTLPPSVFRTVPGFGANAVAAQNRRLIRKRPMNSGGSKGATRCANSPLRASRAPDSAQKWSRGRIFQIGWKTNPPIRRFGEKRQDQPEGEPGGNPDWHHGKRLWKRRLDGRKRLVEDGHVGKCQLALQLGLFRRPFPSVQLLSTKLDVVLQLPKAVALRLNVDQYLLRLLLLGLE